MREVVDVPRETAKKLSVDDQGSLAARYEVASVPTLILFVNGEAAVIAVGPNAPSKSQLMQELAARLGS
jgi:protein-disulfide isomerase-like protein with CxxC motif